jgi:uncharacterized protein (TIGR02145 family)
MRTKILVLLFALALSAGLHAQVTIGDLTAPAKGALLDLNKTVKGGLTLSNVKLDNLYTIPATFPGMSSPPADVKTKFTGAMVYHTGENGIAAGIYVWNGTNWAPVEENCTPLTSAQLSLAPSPSIIVKTGGSVTFSASSGASERCAEGEIYTWLVTPAANYTVQKPSSATSPITFTAAGTYTVKVAVTNRYTNPVPPVESGETTVYVTDNGGVPTTLYSGTYDVAGSPCYDVKRSATEPEAGYTARADSFATGYEKIYTFVHDKKYSNLEVSCEDPHGLVDYIIQPAKKENTSNNFGREPFTVVFKPGVASSIPVAGRDTVKLWVKYTDNAGADKLALRNIRVQDAACHCPARVDRLSDRWLTFACHNLGGKDIITGNELSESNPHTYRGDHYRFGVKVASRVNTGDNFNVSNWTSLPVFTESGVDWPDSHTNPAFGNPCPAGWRLPIKDELAAALSLAGSSNNRTVFQGGLMKIGDKLYFPAAGFVTTAGSLQSINNELFYCSSNVNKAQACAYLYSHSTYSTSSAIRCDLEREYGYSVRCVAVE